MKKKLIVISISFGICILFLNFDFEKQVSQIIKIRLNDTVKTEFIQIDRATTYTPSIGQCDSNPLTTADNSLIDVEKLKANEIKWVSLSRDLILDPYRNKYFPRLGHWNGLFSFGDTIDVQSVSSPQINGKWVVHDCMNARYTNSIDFLLDSQSNKPKLGVCKDLIIKL
jgi:hypothetical protein